VRARQYPVLRIVVAAVALLCCWAYVVRLSWLHKMGTMLVRQEQPFQADVVTVLGGDWFGNRILKAADLVRRGYAPVVLVSGTGYLYGKYEAEMAVPFAIAHGYDASYFRKLEYPATSTKDEARAVVREMRAMHVKRYMLVTSPFHTARAGRIFEAEAPDLELRVLSSEDTQDWEHWWTTRESQKTFLMEWTKSVAARFGI